MSRRLIRIFAFISVLVAGDHALAYFGRLAASKSTMPLAELYSGRGAGDVLILGNSRAMRHFDQERLRRDLGVTVRNYGLLGSSTDFSAVLLDDYLRRYPAPKAVLVEISGLSADNSAAVPQRLYRMESQGLGQLIRNASPEFYYSGLVFHLLDLNSDVYMNSLHKILAPYPDVLLHGAMPLDLAHNKDAVSRPYFTTRPANETALAAIRRLSGEYGFTLIPILAPVSPLLSQTLAGEISDLLKRTEVITGVPPLDLTRLALDDKDFFDPVHLNAEGVSAIHRELVNQLSRRFLLN
ncbi:MAG: hypothetical protein VW600_01815 [Ferrovibrio sp.]